ncbi:hypothetical protein DERF_004743 [Dermatophagoides farinae]|uniref:Uncharacterized protein n=1 Tax=Dermatophagoides farinae TaxID=6954 RepID=A0A922L5V5_DERFA|nr:hypothetical protein DERF_004743 [Dermatophagoides farinae]
MTEVSLSSASTTRRTIAAVSTTTTRAGKQRFKFVQIVQRQSASTAAAVTNTITYPSKKKKTVYIYALIRGAIKLIKPRLSVKNTFHLYMNTKYNTLYILMIQYQNFDTVAPPLLPVMGICVWLTMNS